jgi:hypothetical protein
VTDPFSAVVTAAQAAQTAATAIESQLASDGTTLATLQAEVLQLEADKAALQTLVAQLQAELNPTPAGSGTAFGISASAAGEHATCEQLLGGDQFIASWRYYHQPGELEVWPTEYQLAAGQFFVYSGKVLPQNLTVPMLVSLFRSAPTDRPFYYCVWHEPEDNIKAGQFSAAQLRAGWAVARQAQQQVGDHIKLVPILMGYTWQKGSGRNPEDYLPDDANWDVLGVDTYFGGSIGEPVTAIATGFDSQIATAAAHRKAWGVCETGIGQKVTGAARGAALKLLAQTIRAKGALFATYFRGKGGNQWDLSAADGSAAAWLEGQAA